MNIPPDFQVVSRMHINKRIDEYHEAIAKINAHLESGKFTSQDSINAAHSLIAGHQRKIVILEAARSLV